MVICKHAISLLTQHKSHGDLTASSLYSGVDESISSKKSCKSEVESSPTATAAAAAALCAALYASTATAATTAAATATAVVHPNLPQPTFRSSISSISEEDDDYSIKKLDKLISRYLFCKPTRIDGHKAFASLRIHFDEFSGGIRGEQREDGSRETDGRTDRRTDRLTTDYGKVRQTNRRTNNSHRECKEREEVDLYNVVSTETNLKHRLGRRLTQEEKGSISQVDRFLLESNLDRERDNLYDVLSTASISNWFSLTQKMEINGWMKRIRNLL